jgi:hypothetical protein
MVDLQPDFTKADAMPFFRIFRLERGATRELLFNSDHISKIEVKYVGDNDRAVDARAGNSAPDAKRVYHVYVGGEELELRAKPGCPVVGLIEQIYRDSLKGIEQSQQGDQ